jgi:hypothetical protein
MNKGGNPYQLRSGRVRLAGPAHLKGPYPCDGCCNAERCRGGLACRTLSVFLNTGRVSAAPRKPSRALYEKLFA